MNPKDLPLPVSSPGTQVGMQICIYVDPIGCFVQGFSIPGSSVETFIQAVAGYGVEAVTGDAFLFVGIYPEGDVFWVLTGDPDEAASLWRDPMRIRLWSRQCSTGGRRRLQPLDDAGTCRFAFYDFLDTVGLRIPPNPEDGEGLVPNEGVTYDVTAMLNPKFQDEIPEMGGE